MSFGILGLCLAMATPPPEATPTEAHQHVRPIDSRLLKACEGDNLKRIRLLLRQGANPNAKDKLGQTPMLLLLKAPRFTGRRQIGQPKVTKHDDGTVQYSVYMIEENSVNTSTTDTRALEALISSGANVNAKDQFGTTPAMQAATHKTLKCIKLLVSKGASLKTVDEENSTALDWAAGHNRVEMLRYLTSKGLTAEHKRKSDGVTSLMLETNGGSVESVKLLLDHGAVVNAVSNDGGTALKYAKEAGNQPVIELLKKAGAKE
jgi:ankyrin repeat protein